MTTLPTSPERRRARRIALALSATVREQRKSRAVVHIVDMSSFGCRVELPCGALAEPWIWLSIAGLETQYCRVAWQENDFAGLEFVTPLRDAVLESLMAPHRKVSERLVVRLREIAARASRIALQASEPEQVRPLLEFSRECTEWAAIHGFQLGRTHKQQQSEQVVAPQLTSSLIRRNELASGASMSIELPNQPLE
jgi:hypothetical protein